MKDRNLPSSNDWATPGYVYDELNAEFDFNFDPCPLQNDITVFDGLKADWGERTFCNPPYSKDLKTPFIMKGLEESRKGKLVVFLLPVSTSTKLFHDVLLANSTEPIRFWKGRIKFLGTNSFGDYVTNKSPMHDSMVVIFDGRLNK